MFFGIKWWDVLKLLRVSALILLMNNGICYEFYGFLLSWDLQPLISRMETWIGINTKQSAHEM